MVTNDDLSWFAGVLDAEGSFGLRRHTARKSQVMANAFFGMADLRTVERAKQIAESFYGPLKMHERQPSKKSKRLFFCFNMTRKKELFLFLRAVIPFLRVKRLEALAQYDFLARASKGRHIGTEHDAWLCQISRRLKNADRSAQEDLLARVRDDFAAMSDDRRWLAGYADGDGSVSMARGTRSVFVSFDSANKYELDLVRDLITKSTNTKLPPVVPYESELSDRTQWKLALTSPDQAVALLSWLEPVMVTKRSQAQLALFARKTGDAAERERAIDLIQGLNHGTVSEEVAQSFLRSTRS